MPSTSGARPGSSLATASIDAYFKPAAPRVHPPPLPPSKTRRRGPLASLTPDLAGPAAAVGPRDALTLPDKAASKNETWGSPRPACAGGRGENGAARPEQGTLESDGRQAGGVVIVLDDDDDDDGGARPPRVETKDGARRSTPGYGPPDGAQGLQDQGGPGADGRAAAASASRLGGAAGPPCGEGVRAVLAAAAASRVAHQSVGIGAGEDERGHAALKRSQVAPQSSGASAVHSQRRQLPADPGRGAPRDSIVPGTGPTAANYISIDCDSDTESPAPAVLPLGGAVRGSSLARQPECPKVDESAHESDHAAVMRRAACAAAALQRLTGGTVVRGD